MLQAIIGSYIDLPSMKICGTHLKQISLKLRVILIRKIFSHIPQRFEIEF